MDKKNLLTTIIVGALAGGIVAYALPLLIQPSQDELIAEFYDVETATHVSPHGLRKHIAMMSLLLLTFEVRRNTRQLMLLEHIASQHMHLQISQLMETLKELLMDFLSYGKSSQERIL